MHCLISGLSIAPSDGASGGECIHLTQLPIPSGIAMPIKPSITEKTIIFFLTPLDVSPFLFITFSLKFLVKFLYSFQFLFWQLNIIFFLENRCSSILYKIKTSRLAIVVLTRIFSISLKPAPLRHSQSIFCIISACRLVLRTIEDLTQRTERSWRGVCPMLDGLYELAVHLSGYSLNRTTTT